LRLTGRSEERIALVEAYSKAQGMWRDSSSPDPLFTATLELDLSQVQPSVAGPKRPQDRVTLSDIGASFDLLMEASGRKQQADTDFAVSGEDFALKHGAVVIAAITSCTNTSNPNVLMARSEEHTSELQSRENLVWRLQLDN